MSLVAFIAGRSPGLSTAVHALALAWPAPRPALLAELDPSGGTLSARHDLAPEPGLTNLAAAGRRGLSPETVLRHCRRLPSGVIALVSPVSPDRATSALTVLGRELGDVLEAIPETDVLADCGRFDRRSPARDLVQAARFVVLVITPSVEGVAHAQARLEALSPAPGRLAVLTIGSRPYRPDEVGAALQLPVVGALAHDPTAAGVLNGARPGRAQPPRRSDLRQSAALLARDLFRVLHPAGLCGPPGAPGPPGPLGPLGPPESIETSGAAETPGQAPARASALHGPRQPQRPSDRHRVGSTANRRPSPQ